MGKMTRGVQALERGGVAYTLHPYDMVDEGDSYGAAVAGALGVPMERLFKTLLATVDSMPVVAIVPVSGRLGMKELARGRAARGPR